MLFNNNSPVNAQRISVLSVAHYRNYEEDLKTPSGKGGVTVVYQYELLNSVLMGEVLAVKIGIAVCHEEENFNRVRGRELALARFYGVSGPDFYKKVKKGVQPHSPFNQSFQLFKLIDHSGSTDDDDEIHINYSSTGLMYPDEWVDDSIEDIVRAYLEETLFLDIKQREKTSVADPSEEEELSDEDEDEDDEDED
jgi:hypothetical protein